MNTLVRAFYVSHYYTTKNVGIHLLPVCFLRPTTAQYAVVVISDSQSTKHRVTLFHYVVLCPLGSAHRNVHHSHYGQFAWQMYDYFMKRQ